MKMIASAFLMLATLSAGVRVGDDAAVPIKNVANEDGVAAPVVDADQDQAVITLMNETEANALATREPATIVMAILYYVGQCASGAMGTKTASTVISTMFGKKCQSPAFIKKRKDEVPNMWQVRWKAWLPSFLVPDPDAILKSITTFEDKVKIPTGEFEFNAQIEQWKKDVAALDSDCAAQTGFSDLNPTTAMQHGKTSYGAWGYVAQTLAPIVLKLWEGVNIAKDISGLAVKNLCTGARMLIDENAPDACDAAADMVTFWGQCLKTEDDAKVLQPEWDCETKAKYSPISCGTFTNKATQCKAGEAKYCCLKCPGFEAQ